MSSPYPVLDNRRIDQWKVTELKEELRRRKLMTKGLKDDLIKRLDEAIRKENEIAKGDLDKRFDCVPQPVDQPKDENTQVFAEKNEEIVDHTESKIDLEDSHTIQVDTDDVLGTLGKENVLEAEQVGSIGSSEENTQVFAEKNEENVDHTESKIELEDSHTIQVDTDDVLGTLGKENVLEAELVGATGSSEVEVEQVVQVTQVETSVTVHESLVSETALSGQELRNSDTQNKSEHSNSQLVNEDIEPPHEDTKLNSSYNQVFEVGQVTSDSISTDTVSINEKTELKDNVIADDVKLEPDVKPEMVEPSSSNVILDDGKLQSMDVEEAHENKVSGEGPDGSYTENTADTGKKNDSGDVGSPEKLNLDRSSGDDSMEEDALESRQIDSKFSADEVGNIVEKSEVLGVKVQDSVDAMDVSLPADKKSGDSENKNDLAATAAKRKLHGQETAANNETIKRQRRWNPEGLKVLEPQTTTISPSTTPKEAFQPSIKRNFSRSDSTVSDEMPKERVVPPSLKPSTISLKIDRFLRPFTLKAVQELLGKTGTITSFWMDHIKTHCFVTYSSVEEAVETRNAVYNLKWPPNGGKLLVADFVDPQEVKARLDVPPPSPATPVGTGPVPAPALPQPSPRQQLPKERLPPPPPYPPPPPLSNPPQERERVLLPPPPLPEKIDPPIVTLDDLFRKTKAIPRIYYLPLSDEQVAAKLKAQGKNSKQ